MNRKVKAMPRNASTMPSPRVWVEIRLTQVLGVANFAKGEELVGIARDVMDLADDLSFTASGLSLAASPPARDQPLRMRAFTLLSQVKERAALADPDELRHIVWRVMQVATDLGSEAIEAAEAQLRRLGQSAERVVLRAA